MSLTVLDASGTVRAVETTTPNAFGDHRQMVTFMPGRPTTTANVSLITATGTAQTYGPSSDTTHVMVSVDVADVRYTENGTAPTSTVGILLPAGFVGELPIPVGGSLKFITDNGSAGLSPVVALSPRKYV